MPSEHNLSLKKIINPIENKMNATMFTINSYQKGVAIHWDKDGIGN